MMVDVDSLSVVTWGHELLTKPEAVRDLLQLCERAGRTCYKSEGKTRSVGDAHGHRFIRGIIKRGHLSVIEHGSITVKIICDRSCSHQLVRHRIAAYSQESQRYCDYGELGFQVLCPPSIARLPIGHYRCEYLHHTWNQGVVHKWRWAERPGVTYPEGYRPTPLVLRDHGADCDEIRRGIEYLDHSLACYHRYCSYREEGVPPEDARFVLPNGTKTEVVTTFNLRQWRHVFEERALNPHAQWEIRTIMGGILIDLARLLPAVFGDQVDHLLKVTEKSSG